MPRSSEEMVSVTLPREEVERIRRDAIVAAKKYRAAAIGAEKHGPKTKRNATWVEHCKANADERDAILSSCNDALFGGQQQSDKLPDPYEFADVNEAGGEREPVADICEEGG